MAERQEHPPCPGGCDPAAGIHTRDGGYGFQVRSLCSRPGMTWKTLPLRLLRLDLLDRTASVAPGREAAAHMRDWLQSHVLRGFRRQRRAHATGAMKDEFL